MAGASVAALHLAVAPEAWAQLGFAVEPDGTSAVGATTLVLGGEGTGITGWTLRDAPGDGPVDCIPTTRTADGVPSVPGTHANTAVAVDHVVVTTPDAGRTFAALEESGMTLRREREAGSPERPLRQGFFRHGECIVEVVGPREPEPGGGPATLWGVTIIVSDIDTAAAYLGERLGTVRDAVQPGRRIATLRREVLPGLPVAFMTP